MRRTDPKSPVGGLMKTAAAHPNCCSFWSERIASAEAREAHLPCSATTLALEAQEAREHRILAPAQCMRLLITSPGSTGAQGGSFHCSATTPAPGGGSSSGAISLAPEDILTP